MKNIPVNKAKFFAQYYDQVVMMEGEESTPVFITGYHLKETINGAERFRLQLKPLSHITDEDAICVAKLSKEPFDDGKVWGRTFIKTSLIMGYGFRNHTSVVIRILDYLRSKGYALPYMGTSVKQQIEFGWVEIQTNKK